LFSTKILSRSQSRTCGKSKNVMASALVLVMYLHGSQAPSTDMQVLGRQSYRQVSAGDYRSSNSPSSQTGNVTRKKSCPGSRGSRGSRWEDILFTLTNTTGRYQTSEYQTRVPHEEKANLYAMIPDRRVPAGVGRSTDLRFETG
jgi:hypothetical protein